VAGCCECGDEPSGSCATELVLVLLYAYFLWPLANLIVSRSSEYTSCLVPHALNVAFHDLSGVVHKLSLGVLYKYCNLFAGSVFTMEVYYTPSSIHYS
jgi:hypothetical protein